MVGEPAKVTILIYSYSQAPYIRQAYDSALAQDYPNLEIVGYDNGSKDGTAAIVQSEYASHPKVKFFFCDTSESNQQLAPFRAMRHATGDFISILHGDDYYFPNKIRRQIECFNQLPRDYGVVYGPAYKWNQITGQMWIEQGFRHSGAIFRRMLERFPSEGSIPTISPLIRHECFDRHPYRPELTAEGEDIFFRFAITHKFHFLDVPMVVMRDHLNNMGKVIKLNVSKFVRTMEFLEKEPGLTNTDRAAVRSYVAKTLRNYGWQGIRVANDPCWAREQYFKAVRWDKKQLFHPRTLIGITASFFPSKLLARVNSLLLQILRIKGNAVIKETYS